MRHLKMKFILMIGFLLPVIQVDAQEKEQLRSFLNLALENSHEIKKSRLQVDGAASMRKEVMAAGLPQVEGGLDYSRMGIPKINIPEDALSGLPEEIAPLLQGLAGIKAFHTTSASLTISQLLYSQQYLTGLKQTKLAEELYKTLATKTEEDIIYDVSAGYYRILMSYSNLNMLNNNINNLTKLHNILQLQYENDFVKQTDVSRLKVAITNLNTQKESLLNGIRIQERVLKIVMGIDDDSSALVDTSVVVLMKYSEPSIVEYQPDALVDYQLLKKQIELADMQIKADKATFYPNLAAFGNFSRSSYGTEFKFEDFTNMNTIGLTAKIPIFSSGTRYQKLSQSKLKLQESQESFEMNRKYLETGYQNALNSLFSAWMNLKTQEENKNLANEVYGQVKLQFDEGMASLTDLLNVESSLLDSETLFNQQLLSYKLAEIDLLKATGRIRTLL